MENSKTQDGLSRREFLKTTAVAAATFATIAPFAQSMAHAAGSDELKVGVIGCGGRGIGAALDCLKANEGIRIHALGDLFMDRLSQGLETLQSAFGDKVDVADRKFDGFDNYKKVIATDVDVVILAAPPGFRPPHLRAAIEAGKHVFTEKPVAVDPTGIRSVLESAKMAKEKQLAVVAGTQRRHDPAYIETMKHVHEGAIGEIVGGQCYWMMGDLWVIEQTPQMSDMEWQCRNWLYFDWLSGDHIVEQHVHNLDVINWAFGSHPIKATAMGGRAARTAPKFGNIFDHFAVEYEYENGAKISSMCRQTANCVDRVSERLVGTKGICLPNEGKIFGNNAFSYAGERPNPYEVEHADLIKSIRSGNPLNELEQVAISTMTAILGRMSAYTGREISWEWALNSSKLDLTPQKFEFGENPVNSVPIPGSTQLI